MGVIGETRSFADHLDNIMVQAIQDERPSQSTLDDWNNDALCVKDFFVNVPACDIELGHVNAYISQGVDPEARMVYTDSKSTKIYTHNHIE